MMKARTQLFTTGLIQVYFVAVNTYFLANELYLGVAFASFMISLVWSFNVKRVAFGTITDRIIYATGAMVGSVAGLFSGAKVYAVLISFVA